MEGGGGGREQASRLSSIQASTRGVGAGGGGGGQYLTSAETGTNHFPCTLM